MKYEDICTKRTYEKNGEQKTSWLKVGTLRTTDDNKRFLELNIFPNTSFYIFEQKTKSAAPTEKTSGEEWLDEEQS